MKTQGEPSYPARVPLKIIGTLDSLQAEAIMQVIIKHLGPQEEGGFNAQTNCKGAFIAFTFWVTLPDEQVEKSLRTAIHKLPGVLMQL